MASTPAYTLATSAPSMAASTRAGVITAGGGKGASLITGVTLRTAAVAVAGADASVPCQKAATLVMSRSSTKSVLCAGTAVIDRRTPTGRKLGEATGAVGFTCPSALTKTATAPTFVGASWVSVEGDGPRTGIVSVLLVVAACAGVLRRCVRLRSGLPLDVLRLRFLWRLVAPSGPWRVCVLTVSLEVLAHSSRPLCRGTGEYTQSRETGRELKPATTEAPAVALRANIRGGGIVKPSSDRLSAVRVLCDCVQCLRLDRVGGTTPWYRDSVKLEPK